MLFGLPVLPWGLDKDQRELLTVLISWQSEVYHLHITNRCPTKIINVMSYIKRSDWPSLSNGSWLSSFFDNDRFFDTSFLRTQSVPAANINETDKSFEISLAAPGLSRKDFNVSLVDRVLTIACEKNEEKETKDGDFTRQEYNYSSFSRSFAVPDNVRDEEVNARYEDGVLKITLAKNTLPEQKSRKAIEVH